MNSGEIKAGVKKNSTTAYVFGMILSFCLFALVFSIASYIDRQGDELLKPGTFNPLLPVAWIFFVFAPFMFICILLFLLLEQKYIGFAKGIKAGLIVVISLSIAASVLFTAPTMFGNFKLFF